MVPAFVRPTRNLYQHELLESVTPEIFRGTAMHPCCDVVPLIGYVGKQVRGAYRKYSVSKARREVRKAIEEYEAHMKAQAEKK